MKVRFLICLVSASLVTSTIFAQDQDQQKMNDESVDKAEQTMLHAVLSEYYRQAIPQGLADSQESAVQKAYLELAKKQFEKLPKYWIGVQCEPAKSVPVLVKVPHIGRLFHRGGLKVLSVKPSSPAEKAGIKKDDVIIKVNGKEVNQIAELGLSFEQVKGKNSPLVVIRNQKPITLEVQPAQRAKQDDKKPKVTTNPMSVQQWQDYWLELNNDPARRMAATYWLAAMGPKVKLPADCEVSFKRKGNESVEAQIKVGENTWHVTQSGKSWAVKKGDVKKMPPAVKAYVTRLMQADQVASANPMWMERSLPYMVRQPLLSRQAYWSKQAKPQSVAEKLDKKIDSMAKELNELKKAIQKLRDK